MRRRFWFMAPMITVLILTAMKVAAMAGDPFPFQPKDRVLIIGDSITAQYQYSTNIEIYLTTRFPTWNLTFFNAGISGDTAGGGRNRIGRDVLSETSSLVLVNFGMNDAGYENPSEARYLAYIANQTALTQRILADPVRLVLLSSSAVEARRNPVRLGQYNRELARYAQALRVIAENEGAMFVDQHTPELEVLTQMTKDDAPFSAFPDGIHTNALGGILMARAILLGMSAPAIVSDATIDAAKETVLAAQRTEISNVSLAAGILSFDRRDEALPMVPSNPTAWRQIYPYLNNLDDLNYYGLCVQGLTADRYVLYIDGQAAGTLMRSELEKGVNLAPDHLGPIGTQAQRVSQAIDNKNNRSRLRYTTARQSGLPDNFTPPDFLSLHRKQRDQEAASFDAFYVQTPESIYELAVPNTRRFELRPLP